MTFQYESEEIRSAVRYLKKVGLCGQWVDPDKRSGYTPKPVEISLLEQSRERVQEGSNTSAPLDALQERIDAMLDSVKPDQKARVAEALFFALGTSLDEIEMMRQSFVRPGNPTESMPRAMLSERRQRGTIFT